MPPKGDSIIQSTFLLVSINFLKPALGIILLPLYLNVLTNEEYGLYIMMVSLTGFVSIFGSLRINAAMATFYFDFNDDKQQVKKYLSQLFSFSIIFGSIFFILAASLGPFFFTFFKSDIPFLPYGIIAIATGVLQACNSVFYIYLKNKKKFTFLSLIMFFHVILSVIIQIVMILILKKGVVGLLLGIFIPVVCTFFYILISQKKIFTPKLDFNIIRPSLNYSVALIPFIFIIFFTNKGDKIILEQYLSLGDIGKYGLLMTISYMLVLVADSIINVVRPFLYEMFQQDHQKFTPKINFIIKFYMSANMLSIGGILLIGGNLDLMTDNKSFLEVIPFFILATILAFFRSYLVLFTTQLNYVKRSKVISINSFLAMILLLTLYHFLTPIYGLYGVFIGGISSAIFTSIIFYYSAQKYFKLNYIILDLWIIPICLLIILFIVNTFGPENIRIKSIVLFLCSVGAVFVLLRGSFEEIKNYLKKELKLSQES